MNAPERALGLPEIVSNILSQFRNLELVVLASTALHTEMSRRTPSLLSCMLVNKLWADEATRLAWSQKVSLPVLIRVPKTRRQYYAQNVQSLRIPSTTDFKSSDEADHLNTLEWPRLRELTSHLPARTPNPVFVPSRPFTFDIIPAKCDATDAPKPTTESDIAWRVSTAEKDGSTLSSLEINEDGATSGHGRAAEIVSFLENNPSIKHVSLLSVTSTRDGSIIRYLAARQNLESLSIVLDPCEPAVDALPSSSFLGLKHLSFTGRSDDMVKLIPHLSHLRGLRITLLGNLGTSVTQKSIDGLLLKLCDLKDLEVLQFRTKIWGLLSTTQLVLQGALLLRLARSCHQLNYLDFDASTSPDGSKVTEDDLQQMARALPSLKTLRLPMKPWLSTVTWQALEHLGLFCCQLESLQLGATVKFNNANHRDAVLFPYLKELMIGSPCQATKVLIESEETMSNILDRHFPRLQTVHVPESAVASVSSKSRILFTGKHGFFPIDPCTDWDSRSMGRLGQGSYTLVAKVSCKKLPRFAKDLH